MDTSTYQPERMMYWQSYPSDAEPIYQVYGPSDRFLCADTVLSEYSDWKDRSQWPAAGRESDRRNLSGTTSRVADPLKKRGPIGDFCRKFSPIQDGISRFIPEYIPGPRGRYTYSGSSTSNGVAVYEDKWTYSFHDHDPAHYKLCNIFDLIVIHKFGGDINKATAFITEELRRCAENEADLPPPSPDNELPGLDEVLTGRREDGTYPTTRNNIDAIFLYHPELSGLFAYDDFQKRIVLTRSPFWRTVKPHDNSIRDIDDSEVRRIFLNYGIRADKAISDGLDHEAYRNTFHPVKIYLESLEWDGTPRMASALTDFMGCPATEYTYAVSTLLFQAAVMRIYYPGCKFDSLIAIKGPQGLGKSTFCEKIAKNWFSDSLIDIRDKDALEGIQGVWILEIGELRALRNVSPEAVKSFLSSRADRFRKSYGKRSENYPRSCIFIATTNKVSFLFDRTGNRRFLPVEGTDSPPPRLSVFEDLTESYVDQLWAEAYRSVKSAKFKIKLYLPQELEDDANVLRDAFSQEEPQADAIRNFLIIGIDEDWYTRDVNYRREISQKRMKGRMQEGPVKRALTDTLTHVLQRAGDSTPLTPSYPTGKLHSPFERLQLPVLFVF